MHEAMVHLGAAKSSSIGRCGGGPLLGGHGVAARLLRRCTSRISAGFSGRVCTNLCGVGRWEWWMLRPWVRCKVGVDKLCVAVDKDGSMAVEPGVFRMRVLISLSDETTAHSLLRSSLSSELHCNRQSSSPLPALSFGTTANCSRYLLRSTLCVVTTLQSTTCCAPLEESRRCLARIKEWACVFVGVVGFRGGQCSFYEMFRFVNGLAVEAARDFRHAEGTNCDERERGDNSIVI
jgi:hypothetical protein